VNSYCPEESQVERAGDRNLGAPTADAGRVAIARKSREFAQSLACPVDSVLPKTLWGKEIGFGQDSSRCLSPPSRFRLRVVLMSLLYRLLCRLLGLLVRGGAERELEIIVLRHQLAILGRGGKRPQYTTTDRALLRCSQSPGSTRALVLLSRERGDASPVASGAAAGRSASVPAQSRPSAACRQDPQPH
jgi:hypothetical protein